MWDSIFSLERKKLKFIVRKYSGFEGYCGTTRRDIWSTSFMFNCFKHSSMQGIIEKSNHAPEY